MDFKETLFICRRIHNDHPYGIFYGDNPLRFSFPLMLLELSFLIVISHVVRFILKPFRQPKVVSLIIGGIILGPSVLSRNKKFHKYMFPDNAEYVIKNIGILGFMYFLFISGVKMDVTAIRKVDKKHWYIALVGILIPLCFSLSVAFISRKSLDEELEKTSSIWGIASFLAITAFPVLYHIVKELNLLSSEIGRMALSTAVISDIIGMNGIVIFEASKQGEYKPLAALWYMISLIVMLASIMGVVRQAMMWIVRTTPEGKSVDQIYVVAILLGVMVVGLVADMFGLAIANGPLWLGLAVPDGPPLGAILVEKSETIVMEILMPFSFMYVGMIVDLSSMSSHWSHLQPLVFMVLGGYMIKMVSTLIASRFLDMTVRDSLALSLIMSLRGEVELLLFIHWMDFKVLFFFQLIFLTNYRYVSLLMRMFHLQILDRQDFTVLVLLTLLITALATPLISIIYDPTRPYMVNKRRNIQHLTPNTELHIVACIHGEENLCGLMKFIDLSNPTANSPFSIYALCLVELVGRANPVFINHDNEEKGNNHSNYSSINNALRMFQEVKGECIKVHSYTAITTKRSMYQDICELALSTQSCLIILPLQKNITNNLNGMLAAKQSFQSVSSSVLAHAPCSVGILVDKGPYQNLVNIGVLKSSMHHFVVLFLGGSDAREALSYADRTAGSPGISLTVVRFLAHDNEGDVEVEKKLDDALVTWFWVKHEGNNRIVYREVVVKDGHDTIAAIQAMNNDCCDLWIVGRKQGINPVLLRGLSGWSENGELGVIGEYVASIDFGSGASVLAVQQQILRGQERDSDSIPSKFSWCTKWK